MRRAALSLPGRLVGELGWLELGQTAATTMPPIRTLSTSLRRARSAATALTQPPLMIYTPSLHPHRVAIRCLAEKPSNQVEVSSFSDLEQALRARKKIAVPSLVSLLHQQASPAEILQVISEMEKYPTPIHVDVYNGALAAIFARTQSLSEEALTLFGSMLSANQPNSETFLLVCRHLSSIEQIEALVTEAQARKALVKPLASLALDQYLLLAATLPLKQRRAHAWNLHQMLGKFAKANALVSGEQLVKAIEYLALCRMVIPASKVYNLMRTHIKPSAADIAHHERIITAFSIRPSARAGSLVAGPRVFNFLRGLWENLEDMIEKRGLDPPHSSLHMHCTMASLLATVGDVDAARTLHVLASERFGTALTSDPAFVSSLLLACMRAGDPTSALVFAEGVPASHFTPALAALLFGTVTLVRNFHHTEAIARLVTERLLPSLGPDATHALVADEFRLLALRVTYEELTEHHRAPVLLPVPRSGQGRPGPPRFVLGVCENSIHLLLLTGSGEGVQTSTGVYYSALEDLQAVLATPTSCEGLGCLCHPHGPPPYREPSSPSALQSGTATMPAQERTASGDEASSAKVVKENRVVDKSSKKKGAASRRGKGESEGDESASGRGEKGEEGWKRGRKSRGGQTADDDEDDEQAWR
eukprot:m.5383 g.5383  ORF g.5383 m.5383 type:complete len:648 (+) comp4516_c0_seq2:22-1965(+)